MSDRRLWNPAIETMPAERLQALQLERVRRQVAYNYAGSLHFREKMDAAGVAPGDVGTLADYARIPLMDKDEHRRVQERSLAEFGSPYALLACAPPEKIVRIKGEVKDPGAATPTSPVKEVSPMAPTETKPQ